MAAVRRYQATRLRLLEDLSFQTGALEVATGLGGLAVAALARCWCCTAGSRR